MARTDKRPTVQASQARQEAGRKKCTVTVMETPKPNYCTNPDYTAATEIDKLGKAATLLGTAASVVPHPSAQAFSKVAIAGGSGASLIANTYLARYYPDVQRNTSIASSITLGIIVGRVISSAVGGFAAGNVADALISKYIGDPCQ